MFDVFGREDGGLPVDLICRAVYGRMWVRMCGWRLGSIFYYCMLRWTGARSGMYMRDETTLG